MKITEGCCIISWIKVLNTHWTPGSNIYVTTPQNYKVKIVLINMQSSVVLEPVLE